MVPNLNDGSHESSLFRFMDLPGEIRTKVYDHFFNSTPIHVHIRSTACRPYCQAFRPHPAVNLLLVSRQLHTECYAFFYDAIFVFTVPGLHGDPWPEVVPKSISRRMRRVAAKMGVGEHMLELLDTRIVEYFPQLEDLKIWIFFTSRDYERVEELRKVIHAKRRFRLLLCIRRSIYSRQRFTVSIDHQKDISIFERHPLASDEIVSDFLELFGLEMRRSQQAGPTNHAMMSFWGLVP